MWLCGWLWAKISYPSEHKLTGKLYWLATPCVCVFSTRFWPTPKWTVRGLCCWSFLGSGGVVPCHFLHAFRRFMSQLLSTLEFLHKDSQCRVDLLCMQTRQEHVTISSQCPQAPKNSSRVLKELKLGPRPGARLLLPQRASWLVASPASGCQNYPATCQTKR